MVTCREVADILEEIAPKSLAETWDNPGFLIGGQNDSAEKILVALDVTEEVVDEAIAGGFEVIIAHHPLIFHGIKQIHTDSTEGRVLQKILRHGLAIFAAHTNLDSAKGGVNDVLAASIGLTIDKPLAEDGHLGRVGHLSKDLAPVDFALHVKKTLGAPMVRLSGAGQTKVKTIAVLGGSGASFLERAAEVGADAFLTGDMRYHEAQRAESLGLWVVDAGHFWTEMPIVEALAERLRQTFASQAVQIVSYAKQRDTFRFI